MITEFKKYNSIENTYRSAFLERIESQGLSGGEWVVTEKIHGANFSFWYDGSTFKVASRNQFVDGSFYNCQDVIDKYKQNIIDMYTKYMLEGQVLTVYGELYGEGVQRGVFYKDHKDFCAFDVVCDGYIQDFDCASKMLKEFNVPVAPFVFQGCLQECLELDNTFDSLISGKEDNTAEGFVIKPLSVKYLSNGSRVILKNKTEKFSEKSKRVKVPVNLTLNEQEQKMLDNLLCYITENRLKNVISKIGSVTTKDFGKLVGLLNQDVLDEFSKDNSFDKKSEEYKKISKLFNKEISNLIRSNFLNIIDGVF